MVVRLREERRVHCFNHGHVEVIKGAVEEDARPQFGRFKHLSGAQGRRHGLVERVWRYVGQYRDQLETALDVGLGEGRSAQELARDVKKNLRDPDRLFRRVRDKRGNLVLSKAARAFHPGKVSIGRA